MQIVKNYVRDANTEAVSKIFDRLITTSEIHLPLDRLELHIRDASVSLIEENGGVICLDYNNPMILDRDQRGIKILIMHELFRLMFKYDLPRDIEDVIIGREMIRRGFGEELCYLYYNSILKSRAETRQDYIRLSLPWIIFVKDDKFNSELFKKLASKLCKRKFGECRKLFDILIDLSEKNMQEAVSEYNSLVS